MNWKNLFQKPYIGFNILFIPSKINDYKPKFLQSNALYYVAFFLLLVKIITINLFIPWPQNIFFADVTKVDLVNILNQERTRAGLKSLQENNQLDQAAMLKAEDMISKDYFAHQSPDGISPWFWFSKVGYEYTYAGENLAVGFINSKEIFDAWINSKEHRENLFSANYTQVGTAIMSGFGQNNATVVVQLFGSKKEEQIIPSMVNNEPTTTQQMPQTTINNSEHNAIKEVLGQSTKSTYNFYDSFINFIVYDHEKVITYILYIFLLIVNLSLLTNILINYNIQRWHLIIKSMLLMVIILLTILLDKNLINVLILHS